MLNKINGIKTIEKIKKNIYIQTKKYILTAKEFIKDLFEIKKNKGINTTTIIWIVLLIGTVASLGTLKLVSDYVEKIDSKQISLVNTIYDKFYAFSTENNKIKNTKQSFVEVIKNKKFNKTHEVLNKLLNEAIEIQPKIDELKILTQNNINISKRENYKAIFRSYLKAANLQYKDNKKLIEMITLGLTMNWKNPTQEQMNSWRVLASELGYIENEIKTVQLEIQNNLYKK